MCGGVWQGGRCPEWASGGDQLGLWKDQLHHSLSISDSEELSHRGEGLVVLLSLPRRKGQGTGPEAEEELLGWFSEKYCLPTNAELFFLLYQMVLKMRFY